MFVERYDVLCGLIILRLNCVFSLLYTDMVFPSNYFYYYYSVIQFGFVCPGQARFFCIFTLQHGLSISLIVFILDFEGLELVFSIQICCVQHEIFILNSDVFQLLFFMSKIITIQSDSQFCFVFTVVTSMNKLIKQYQRIQYHCS